MLAGRLEVLYRPNLLTSSRQVRMVRVTDELGCRNVMIAWSPAVLRIVLASFAAWHDEPDHCRTWTDAAGCRCEVEPL